METAGTGSAGDDELARVNETLERLRPLFMAAFPDEAHTLEEIEADVRAQRALVAFSQDGQSFAIVEPVWDLHIRTVGGSMRGVLELEGSISDSAAKRGFDRMTALPSRRNWDLALRERGWKAEAALPLVKDLGR